MDYPVPGPFGVWLAMERADYIFYQRETSPAHQVHITLHEIGHLVADHHGGGGDDDLLGLLSPGTPPEAVWRALRRTSYDTEQEHAAETVATLILQWASVLDAVVPRLSAGTAERRMHGALGDRMGWLERHLGDGAIEALVDAAVAAGRLRPRQRPATRHRSGRARPGSTDLVPSVTSH